MRLLQITLCVLAFLSPGKLIAGKNTIDTILCFDRNLLHVENIECDDGKIYTRLSYPNCRSLENVSFPELPVFHICVQLPSEAEDIRITAQAYKTENILFDKPIYPVQYVSFTNGEIPEPQFKKLDIQSFINSKSNNLASITDISNWNDTCKMVGVDVLPIGYNSKNKEYFFSKEVHVMLDYTLSLSDMTKKSASLQFTPEIGLPYYKYCIITSKKLEDSFLRLVGWMKQKGMDTGVICIEDILSCEVITGDTVSRLYDEAGKVRQYLQYAYRLGGTEYVLFGGDSSILPIRYGESNEDGIFSLNPNDLHIPSDFYFSELTSNWNHDNDDCYGEYEDITEFRSQLKVGRLLCSSAEDVDNYIDKLLRYETKPGNGDEAYLRKIFLTQADQMQVEDQAGKIASSISDIYPEQTIVSCGLGDVSTDTIDYTGTEIINMMKRKYGYVSWMNHGVSTALILKYKLDTSRPRYGVTALSGDDAVTYESSNGIEKLGNKDYPMIAYSIACSTTPFDEYDEGNSNNINLGKSFTVGKDYGGPAYIGNTRVGLVSHTYKVQQIFNQNINDCTVADALNKAKYSNMSYRQHNALTVNLIGIPNLYVWTDTPKKFNAYLEYYDTGADLYTDSDINEAYWCTWRLNETGDSISCDMFNPSYIQSTLTDIENGVITLTGKNCIPQIMPLRLRNVHLHGKRYMFLSDATIGEDYRDEYDSPVVFASDSKTTMEHYGKIKFDKNVIVYKGATLTVIPSKIE